MELFEQIRREHEHGGGTIRGIAKKLGIHRRMVREALASAVPKDRKIPARARPKLARAIPFIEAILEANWPPIAAAPCGVCARPARASLARIPSCLCPGAESQRVHLRPSLAARTRQSLPERLEPTQSSRRPRPAPHALPPYARRGLLEAGRPLRVILNSRGHR